jgi:hypothetical protein
LRYTQLKLNGFKTLMNDDDEVSGMRKKRGETTSGKK